MLAVQGALLLPNQPMHEVRYLLGTACLTLWLTGQRQQLWEAREPGPTVKLGLGHSDAMHMCGNVRVEHWPFAEARAPDVPKRHSGVVYLCHNTVASLAHYSITGVHEGRRKHGRAIGQDKHIVVLLHTVPGPQHHETGVAVLL